MEIILVKLKDWVDPNYWASKVGEKSGAYDKAKDSSFRRWADGLEGWKWWTWQIVGGGMFFIFLEIILSTFGLTLLPWK